MHLGGVEVIRHVNWAQEKVFSEKISAFLPLRRATNNLAISSAVHLGGIHISRLEEQIPGLQKNMKIKGFGEVFAGKES